MYKILYRDMLCFEHELKATKLSSLLLYNAYVRRTVYTISIGQGLGVVLLRGTSQMLILTIILVNQVYIGATLSQRG